MSSRGSLRLLTLQCLVYPTPTSVAALSADTWLALRSKARSRRAMLSQILGGKPPREFLSCMLLAPTISTGASCNAGNWTKVGWQLEAQSCSGRRISGNNISGHCSSDCLIIVSLGVLVIYLLFERKKLHRAQKAQEQLSGLLITTQEQERSRLASEIHDDFSQRMAVLSLGLETAAERVSESTPEANQQMQELMESASEIGADLHTLSHRLHSSTLERLGLAAGVGSFCKEFNAQHGIPLAFSHHNVPPSVSPEIALCLFRIVPGRLRNVQKHSRAAHAEVNLEMLDGELHLSISDEGKGFDTNAVSGRQGLGLWSMRERARMVAGRLEVHSEKDNGTRIDVWTPICTGVRRDSE